MAVNRVDLKSGENLIDLTADTVSEETLAEGVTAHNSKGEQIVGTMSGGGGEAKEEQDKAVTITENNSTTVITPDDGKTLSSVTIDVQVAAGGDDAAIDGLLEDSLVDMVSGATSVDPYSAYQRNALKTVRLPNATTIGIYAFNTCSVLNSFIAPSVTSIGNYAFSSCTKLTAINLPKVKTIGNYAFQACTGLSRVDLGTAVTQIGAQAFFNNPITALIIRRTSGVPTLTSTSAFTNSGIAKGTGYIYVPSALLSTYQSANNWKNYTNQFRAIEDYPDITGG